MKRYQGARASSRNGGEVRAVWVFNAGEEDRILEPLARHVPADWRMPISWGWPGNACLNLAYTILSDCLPERAEALYRRFATDVLERLPMRRFELCEMDIIEWAKMKCGNQEEVRGGCIADINH